MKVKVIQDYPVNCGQMHYQTGDEFELDDVEAARFIEEKRVTEVKNLKTGDKNTQSEEDRLLSPEEREAKIKAAVAELLAAKPDDKPKCSDIVALTGIKDVSAKERDAAVEAAKAGNIAKPQVEE